MRIPSGTTLNKHFWEVWYNTAAQLGLKHNVFIDVDYETDADKCYVLRVYFKCEGHEFNSLDELERALALKAFL
jgi:hypothetical protein